MSNRTLIINADDLGYDPAVTRGILEAMRAGLVSSATLMVNTPFSEEAARQAEGLGLGLHLNLARGRPLSGAIPAALLSGGAFSEPRAPELPAAAVEAEALAQLDRLEALLGRPATHLDVHKHLHRHPPILAGLIAAARQRNLPLRAIDPPMRDTIRRAGPRTTDHFIGDTGAEAYWTLARLLHALETLPEGITELMCHPGLAPSAVQSGYSAQREVELAAFLHPDARRRLDALGIRLATFAALGYPP